MAKGTPDYWESINPLAKGEGEFERFEFTLSDDAEQTLLDFSGKGELVFIAIHAGNQETIFPGPTNLKVFIDGEITPTYGQTLIDITDIGGKYLFESANLGAYAHDEQLNEIGIYIKFNFSYRTSFKVTIIPPIGNDQAIKYVGVILYTDVSETTG